MAQGRLVSQPAINLEQGMWSIVAWPPAPKTPYSLDGFFGPYGWVNADSFVEFRDGVVRGVAGCGTISGHYHLHSDSMSVSTKWARSRPCELDEDGQGRRMVSGLNGDLTVSASAYSGISLSNHAGATRIVLAMRQPGQDLSELRGSFWEITRMPGFDEPLSRMIVSFERGLMALADTNRRGYQFDFGRLGKPQLEWTKESSDLDPPKEGHAEEEFGVQSLHLTFPIPQPKPQVVYFDQLVTRISAYRVVGERLSMMDKDFAPIIEARRISPEGVEYRRWRIVAYRSDGRLNASPSDLDADITLFGGTLAGSPGVGPWSGSYQLTGDKLHFDAGLSATTGVWPAIATSQTNEVFDAFRKVSRFVSRGGTYQLLGPSDEIEVVLAPWPASARLRDSKRGIFAFCPERRGACGAARTWAVGPEDWR